jgi:peroxiredoxin
MLKFLSIAKITAVAAVATFASIAANAADRISDFSLVDQEGRFFQLSRNSNQKAIVLISYDDSSKDARRAASELADIAEDFADQKVAFAIVNVTSEADKNVIRKIANDRKIDIRILMDNSQLVAEEIGLTRTAEAIIIDPVAKTVVYRGAISKAVAKGSRSERNAASYVADALTAMLAGQDIAQTQLASKGEVITFPMMTAHQDSLSYAKDIAPILEERCVTCHQEGGIAPFAMSSHQMIQGWSPMIREVLITKRMPPGQVGTEYANQFHGVNQISVEETQKLVHWIDSGARNDSSTDPLAEYKISPVKWGHGEPDMIVNIPPQTIPATGTVEYRNLVLPLDLPEDKWVKAVEFVAGDTTVLHHIIAWAQAPDTGSGRGGAFGILNQGIGLGAYAPGNTINTYPDGAGFPLSQGSGLILQMHYTSSGKETVDASEIGIHFWDEEPERAILGGSAADLEISIAPFEANHEMVASKKFRKDAYLTMVGPHMHYRGKDANFKLVYPDGTEEEILNVPNYQFNWQKTYDFKEPKFLPAGTEMVFRATFDNSAMNPYNPDPSAEISWGEQTWQEMMFGFFRYVDADSEEASDGE